MKKLAPTMTSLLAALWLGLGITPMLHAQTTAIPAAPVASAPAADVWNYKTRRLDRSAVDALLAKPKQLVVIDVRRPDEVTAKGSFPVFLNVQAADLAQRLDYIPRDRLILTVSNHAHRAGAAGDLLASKGFKVAGAAGSEDYEAQGGTITRIVPPVKK
ncbi:rhodanese-like domain-containing protein [Ideonella sp. YS5]|uniref:rhodanese-like domain-containing protein n=1 Tax=Ideonella sp. YS5 TaxID=3453714 RepID=UPI003EEA9E6B